MRNGKAIFIVAILTTVLSVPMAVQAQSSDPMREVNCDKGESIQKRIDRATDGDVINVIGNCSENIQIHHRLNRIILDGQGRARINGSDETIPTMIVYGRAITIKGFVITGGRNGITIGRGGTVIIDSNVIEKSLSDGILLTNHSHARIVRSTIRNIRRHGIVVAEGSSARIGFITPRDPGPSSNTIDGSPGSGKPTRNGIHVNRNSSARIIGNNIINFGRNGVLVKTGSQAEIRGNNINNNGWDGIFVTENSGVNIGTDVSLTGSPFNDTNTGENKKLGVRCSVGGYVSGRLGTLDANDEPIFEKGCINNLLP
jgi:nitrous oxidase accessory protein NosD